MGPIWYIATQSVDPFDFILIPVFSSHRLTNTKEGNVSFREKRPLNSRTPNTPFSQIPSSCRIGGHSDK